MEKMIKGRVAFNLYGVYSYVVDVTVKPTSDGFWDILSEDIIEQGCDHMASTRGEWEYAEQLAAAVQELVDNHRRFDDMSDKIANGATFMEA